MLWNLTHNPWVVLQTVSRDKLQSVLEDPVFRKTLDDLVQTRRDAAEKSAWFQQTHSSSVWLLYQQGYFRQMIDKDGVQQALFPYNDPGQLPITPLRKANGEWLRLEIVLPGYSVWLRAWQVQVGRVKLYLLDSNDAANYPAHRGITSELYANCVDGNAAERVEMQCVRQLVGELSGYAYHAEMPATRPATDYTARLIPQYEAVAVPLEDEHILWQS